MDPRGRARVRDGGKVMVVTRVRNRNMVRIRISLGVEGIVKVGFGLRRPDSMQLHSPRGRHVQGRVEVRVLASPASWLEGG